MVSNFVIRNKNVVICVQRFNGDLMDNNANNNNASNNSVNNANAKNTNAHDANNANNANANNFKNDVCSYHYQGSLLRP